MNDRARTLTFGEAVTFVIFLVVLLLMAATQKSCSECMEEFPGSVVNPRCSWVWD